MCCRLGHISSRNLCGGNLQATYARGVLTHSTLSFVQYILLGSSIVVVSSVPGDMQGRVLSMKATGNPSIATEPARYSSLDIVANVERLSEERV